MKTRFACLLSLALVLLPLGVAANPFEGLGRAATVRRLCGAGQPADTLTKLMADVGKTTPAVAGGPLAEALVPGGPGTALFEAGSPPNGMTGRVAQGLQVDGVEWLEFYTDRTPQLDRGIANWAALSGSDAGWLREHGEAVHSIVSSSVSPAEGNVYLDSAAVQLTPLDYFDAHIDEGGYFRVITALPEEGLEIPATWFLASPHRRPDPWEAPPRDAFTRAAAGQQLLLTGYDRADLATSIFQGVGLRVPGTWHSSPDFEGLRGLLIYDFTTDLWEDLHYARWKLMLAAKDHLKRDGPRVTPALFADDPLVLRYWSLLPENPHLVNAAREYGAGITREEADRVVGDLLDVAPRPE